MTGRGPAIFRILRGVGRAVRDGWLIVGATLLLIVSLEVAYRGLDTGRKVVRAWLAPADRSAPANPFFATDWADDLLVGALKEEAVEWAPYVQLKNPTFSTRHMTVDEQGHRVTPHAQTGGEGLPPIRVFFLGGSTTFGWYQRDGYTIPAEAARRLQRHLGDTARVEVTNFGAPGRTFTQEVIELMLQLRAGARPDVVVFYDGINDVMATVQNRRAGVPQNERRRIEDFARGQRLEDRQKPGLARDAAALADAGLTAGSRLQFAQLLTGLKRGPSSTPPDVPALAKDLAAMYASTAPLVEAMAARYGFEPIYVWQAALLNSKKPLTSYEKWLIRDDAVFGIGPIRDLHVAAPPLIGQTMAPIAAERFIDATTLFDSDATDVYVDLFGHTYESANPRIVEAMMPALGGAASRAAIRHQGS